MRIAAIEDLLATELALGHSRETLAQLVRLTEEHPLRERLVGLHMQALSGAGRQDEALSVYERTRARLGEELGVEPGPALRELHRSLLRGTQPPQPALTAAERPDPAGPAPAQVPRQLPANPPWFTGRQHHLRQLDEWSADQVGAPRIMAVEGSAGVGKTALAVQWGHQVRHRFPDGQLYLDLRGYSAGVPASPLQALTQLLHALGLPPERVPDKLDEAAATYRSLLAGKHLLVLLDNAAGSAQVRPLLPGERGCAVLVTSRNELTGLLAREGARRLVLGPLAPDESLDLLRALLGAERVEAERTATADLARCCGNLPLALRIAAAHMTTRRSASVAALVAKLGSRDRLAALTLTGDEDTGVSTAFDLSYRRMPPPTRRLFRLLGLAPGVDISGEATAALAGSPPGAVDDSLDELVRAHLVDKPAADRYVLHDLLKAYAAHRANQEETSEWRRAAVRRLRRWYLGSVDRAAQVLYPQTLRLPTPDPLPGLPPYPRFDEPTAALAWLDAERVNLIACVTHVAEHDEDAEPPWCPERWLLADALRGYLWLRLNFVDWSTVAQASLAATTAAGDRPGEFSARVSLAQLAARRGRYRAATQHAASAHRVAAAIAWPEAEAAAGHVLGASFVEAGHPREAVDHLSGALRLARKAGWRHGEVMALGLLMVAYRDLGKLDAAARTASAVMAMSGTKTLRLVSADAHAYLGDVAYKRNQLDTAVHLLTRAVEQMRAGGNDGFAGVTLCRLARVHQDAGRAQHAMKLADTGVQLACASGHDGFHADAFAVRADIRLAAGDCTAAARELTEATRLANASNNRYLLAEVLLCRATAHLRLGQADSAGRCAEHARELTRQCGFRLLEASALTMLAEVSLARGRRGEARRLAEQAVAWHRETGHRLGELRTLALLRRLPAHPTPSAEAFC